MDAFGPLSSLVLGFVAVMAGVSMLVTLTVRVVQRVFNRRAIALAEMLSDLNHAFRSHHGDYGAAGDAADAAFVVDVLNDAGLASAGKGSSESLTSERKEAVEFIARKDLIAIIERYAADDTLPRRWHVALPANLARGTTFIEWIEQWFATIEGNSSERFRKEAGRKAMVISAILVAVLNLDAIQLSLDLFNQAALANELSKHAPGLLHLVDKNGADPESPPTKEEWRQLIQINSMLNLPELKLGWQRGTFVEKYCAWSHACEVPTSLTDEPPEDISTAEFVLYVCRWLFGLIASTMLLWLGAPFWADRLRSLLGNSVEKKLRGARQKEDEPATA